MEKKPRAHAEVIKAWADGAQIEYRSPGAVKWIDAPDPAFIEDYEYRVKPDDPYQEGIAAARAEVSFWTNPYSDIGAARESFHRWFAGWCNEKQKIGCGK